MRRKPTFDVSAIPYGEHGAARRHIDEQIALVATLTPGSDDHRVATDLLLLMQDGLALLNRTREMIRQIEAKPRRNGK